MSTRSIRANRHPGKAAFEPPRELLASARALAREHARSHGTTVVAATRAVSETYTRDRGALASLRDTNARLVAGLGFFLGRDLPKAASVFGELHLRGLVPTRDTLRVLDLGAGVGATTFSLAHAAREGGFAERLAVEAVDLDAPVLAAMQRLAAVRDEKLVPTRVTATVADLEEVARTRPGPYDVVLLGLALNELAHDVGARAALLVELTTRLAPDGLLLVLEPALAATSRALSEVRDALVHEGVAVVYPCTHDAPCPMLAGERDWCHAELELDLAPEEAAVAREAGLREDRPTFAALAIARRERAIDPALMRVVSRPLGSKGKTELVTCGAHGLVRMRELDREPAEPPLASFARGDLVRVESASGDAATGQEKDAYRVPRDARLEPFVTPLGKDR